MILGNIADGLTRGVEGAVSTVSEAFFEPVIRLGVTGLSRAGKTIFITSLVANLLNRARMPGLVAASEGRIEAAFLQPQPDDTLPRFDYETHLGALTAAVPRWPESTRSVSELRLSLRVRPQGLLAGLQGPRTVHIDIVDYPGEWLLDLALLDKSFAEWSSDTLAKVEARDLGAGYRAVLAGTDITAKLAEPAAQALAAAYTGYIHAAREAGYSDCSPGRFHLPGDLAGSPALTFAPLPPGSAPRGSLAREFERRYEAYKARIVKPFFRDHFARIDRQIVLVDVLGAIHAGPAALDDLRVAMAELLGVFRPGRNAFLSQIFLGKRIEKILFAATKADHVHQSQHGRLTAIAESLLSEAKSRADFAGAQTRALSVAALRATTEATVTHAGAPLDVVRGRLLDTGKEAAFHPGDLPEDPARLLGPARDGAEVWLDGDYGVMRFAPQPMSLKPGEGPPHIRLDQAAEFLIGDRL
ncbi:MAG: YcjX family protein [Paracoccaceae bacterium]|nr:YcjX family protein [Paracoccaceae bacterium]